MRFNYRKMRRHKSINPKHDPMIEKNGSPTLREKDAALLE